MRRAAGVVAAGILLGVVAMAFDTSILFVPAVALLVIGLLVPPWVWLAALSTSVTRSIDAERIVEDQAVEAQIEVRGGPLGVPGGEVIDPLAGGSIAIRGLLFAPPGGRSTQVKVVVRFSRRGRRTIEPPALLLRDPLGLIQLVRQGREEPHSLLVLPRLDRARWARQNVGASLDQATGAPPLEALAAVEVDGLRPYRQGTPASRISWPALARGAGLLERRMRAEREAGPLVVLDARCAGPEERIDAAVRAAASLSHDLGRRFGCDLLLPDVRRPLRIEPDMTAWPEAHACLALLEGGPHCTPPSLSARPRGSMVFYVAAQREHLPLQLMRGGHQGAVLVLPKDVAPPVRRSPRFEVSGCVGYVLSAGGRLDAGERAA